MRSRTVLDQKGRRRGRGTLGIKSLIAERIAEIAFFRQTMSPYFGIVAVRAGDATIAEFRTATAGTASSIPRPIP
jgi:hypothetical protein